MNWPLAAIRSFPQGLSSVVVFSILLLVARTLGLISTYFLEEDEISLAVGAAALLHDTSGTLYRYTVQVGYYRLVELLDVMLGGRVDAIPWILKGLSAIAGVVIPVAGLFAFKDQLTLRQRQLVSFGLVVNPIVWRSSQYGNTAIVSTALATVALVLLTNHVRGWRRIGALTLLACAVLVRADAVLLMPVAFLLLLRSERSMSSAIKTMAAFGLAVAAVYGGLSLFDPRMDSAVQSVARHMQSTPNPTLFWEFLLWSISPLPFVLAIWGFRELLARAPSLAVALVVWSVPTLLFYLQATTSPRYFLNVAVPVSVAAAIGMTDVAWQLQRWMKVSLAWSAVLICATLHLFIALGHVTPGQPLEWLYRGTFTTHDGPMPTGALLARTYLPSGSLLRGLPRPRFAAASEPFWEGVAYTKVVRLLAEPTSPRQEVLVIVDGPWVNAFHFHAHAGGARYETGPIDSAMLWGSPIRFQLGHSRVTAVARRWEGFEALTEFPLNPGDRVWVVGNPPPVDATLTAKIPAGLTLNPTGSVDEHYRTFEVASVERPSER